MAVSITSLLAEELGVSERRARTLVRAMVDELRHRTAEGDDVEIPGFGTFAEEDGRLAFRPSESLARAVNHRFDGLDVEPVDRPGLQPTAGPPPSDPNDPPATDDDLSSDSDSDSAEAETSDTQTAGVEPEDASSAFSWDATDEPEAAPDASPTRPTPSDEDAEASPSPEEDPDAEFGEWLRAAASPPVPETEDGNAPPVTTPLDARLDDAPLQADSGDAETSDDAASGGASSPAPASADSGDRPPEASSRPARSSRTRRPRSRSAQQPPLQRLAAALIVLALAGAGLWFLLTQTGALNGTDRPAADSPAATPQAQSQSAAVSPAASDTAASDTAASPTTASSADTAEAGARAAQASTPDTSAARVAASGSSPVESADAIDPANGGLTIVVHSGPTRESAQSWLQTNQPQLEALDLPSDILRGTTGDGAVRFRVVLGQFETPDEARAALEQYADRLPSGAWLLPL